AATAVVLALLAGAAVSAWRRSGVRSGRTPTIAVLPFANAFGDATQDYFADGTTEALIGELGRLRNARIIALSSVLRHRGSSPKLAGAELGADFVGVGSVSRAGERLRVDIRLVETRTGRVLWMNTYDRDVRDVLALQGEIVRGLASAGGLPIDEDAKRRFAAQRSVEPRVYEAYLRGRYHWNQRTEPSLLHAVHDLEEAVAFDATYAPAYAALADCYNQLGTVLIGNGSPAVWRPKAARAAIQALQIDPYLADAHAALGYVRHYNWEWAASERDLRRALELNPSYALAHVWYANLLASLGRMDDALREVELARDLDPFSLVVNTNVGWTLSMAGRPNDAIAQLTRTLEIDPDYPQAHLRLGGAYLAAGRTADGLRSLEANARLSGRSPSSLASLAQGYAIAGRSEKARELLREVLETASQRYVSPGAIAMVYAAFGEADPYFTWMEKAFAERANGLAYARLGAASSPFRDDPRQRDLIRRVGFP
ncbi:MAG: tetratricopeptide repeat protein, partial [Acidobacteriota bacterium]